jgi:hypothetical protein
MKPYDMCVAFLLLVLLTGCHAVDDDDDDDKSEIISSAIAACIPIYTALNTQTSHAPQHARLMATEIRQAHSTTCCARSPPCCSYFSLQRIYNLRIFFWSMEKTVASSWLLGFTSNSYYSIDKLVRRY